MDWIMGVLLSGMVAGAAYWKRSLTGSGAVAAIGVGTVLYALGSLPWFGTLIAFFLSSTLLSKWKKRKKAALEAVYEKSGRRDAGQVLANGGLGVLICVLHVFLPENPAWFMAFLGVMATVNADTWATEVGGLSRSTPRSILTWQRVPAGTSGGVSMLGTVATMLGGVFIGATAWVLAFVNARADRYGHHLSAGDWEDLRNLLLVCLIAGTIGSLVDSWMGAKWQAMYRCSSCDRELERREHCGDKTQHVRGWRWMNNDRVNLLSSVIGAGVAVLVAGGL